MDPSVLHMLGLVSEREAFIGHSFPYLFLSFPSLISSFLFLSYVQDGMERTGKGGRHERRGEESRRNGSIGISKYTHSLLPVSRTCHSLL